MDKLKKDLAETARTVQEQGPDVVGERLQHHTSPAAERLGRIDEGGWLSTVAGGRVAGPKGQ
jgi:hypothetical protein